MKRTARSLLLMFAVSTALVLTSTSAWAAAGDLDHSFGGTGKVVTDLGMDDHGYAVAVQSGWTGHIVDDGVGNFAFARYTSSGALDTSFGAAGTGKVVAGFGGYDIATSVAMEPNGQIPAAGFTDRRGTFDFAVMKLTAGGRLQKSFGHGGGTIADFGGDEFANGIALQSNGKIVVGGWRDEVPPDTYAEFSIMRLDADGTLDASFGSNGGRLVHMGEFGDDGLGAVAIDPSSGKILQSGYTYNPQGGTHDFATVRYLAS